MIINYYTHKPEESKTKHVYVGSKLVGIRLLSVTLETQEELNLLLTEKGIEWARRNMRFKMQPTLPSPATGDRAVCDWDK